MKKIMLLLLVLAVTCTGVFAGGGSQQQAAPAGATVLRWSYWGGEARLRAIQQALDAFADSTGFGIIVAGEPAPGTNEHFNKVKTQFVGGNAPDLIQLGGDFNNIITGDNNVVAPGIENWLLPLDDYVKKGILDISKVDPAAIQAGTRSGILYAIPVASNMPCILYNKAWLTRIGAPQPNVSMTWAEFETWMAAVKARLPANTWVLTDYSATQSGSLFFGYWAGQNKTPQWDGTKTLMTAAAAQQYLELWAKWRTSGWVPPAATSADYAETNESSSIMIAGKTIATVAWSNAITAYQGATRDELGIIELPNAAATNGLWGQMSQMTGINKNSKNPEAAVKFLSFFTNSPEVDKQRAALGYGIPVTAPGRAAMQTGADANTVKQLEYLNVAGRHASPRNPNMPNDTEWNSGLHLIAQNVAYGRVTPAAGGQQIMDLINRLIAAAR